MRPSTYSADCLAQGNARRCVTSLSNYALFHYPREPNQGIWFVHSLLLNVLYGCYATAQWLRPQAERRATSV